MGNVVNDSVFALARQEAADLARRPDFWAVMAVVSVVVGLTGPFGTFAEMRLGPRLAYWLVVCFGTFWVGFLPASAGYAAFERRGLGELASLILSALVASLPVTLWLGALHTVIFGASIWDEAVRLFPYTAVLSVAVIAMFDHVAYGAAPGPAQRSDRPAWLDTLPAPVGRDLILLQAQDHYVRVETATGQTLLRMRLRDAEEALGGYGLRVHRSWWVARAWLGSYAYRKGAPVVVLKNGAEVPVGRAYRKAVRAALGR